jgi:hypothetical protein
MRTLKEYLKYNPIETEEERNLSEFAAKIETRLLSAEKIMRDLLPEWHDEVTDSDGCKICCEMTNRDVMMIRDFLLNG